MHQNMISAKRETLIAASLLFHPTLRRSVMGKSRDTKKEEKKKPAKSIKEKRKEKQEKQKEK
ncbi:uncharacterized protein Dmul_36360 [Desulfococcus multivorans]|nr:uncharacterized protein Dmul_36360 [Desulfococcus multivorans]